MSWMLLTMLCLRVVFINVGLHLSASLSGSPSDRHMAASRLHNVLIYCRFRCLISDDVDGYHADSPVVHQAYYYCYTSTTCLCVANTSMQYLYSCTKSEMFIEIRFCNEFEHKLALKHL